MSQRPIGVNEIQGLWSFIATIDWEERWLWLLIGFHLLSLLIIFLTRHHMTIQIPIFFLFLGLVYFSESLNELGAMYWRSFSKQQYFDSHGIFISVLMSAPLLINCGVIVTFWVAESYQMMVKVKRAQLKHKSRQQEVKEK